MPRAVFETYQLLVLGMLGVCSSATQAADPAPQLHCQIDALISARATGPLAAQTSDAEFVRRIYLDLAGRIPALVETQDFLADGSSDKRSALIDRLLASDDHVRRMTQVFHVMLMERLGDHVEWQKFLHESFAANRPWDQIVQNILNPNADDELARGSAFWFTKRLEKYGQNPVDIPGLVRDVGRHFLGIDVQCAQCHDHLFVDDYKQEFYHGLLAFVGHSEIRTDVKFPAVAVKPLEKKAEFLSVFVQQPRSIGPKLPGRPEIEIPSLAKGAEFAQPPDKKTKFPGVPRFNTLELLAKELPSVDNRLFSRNIANRLWWLMMGRGLVDPLDLQHSANPPSHPELLSALADALVEHKFDMRWMLREIALSDAYQRASAAADNVSIRSPPQCYCVALEKPLSSEQIFASLRQALSDGQPLAVKNGDKRWGQWQALFDKAFANPAREPEVGHNPTVKAALFLMHDTTVLEWIKPAADNLTARLLRHDDPALLAGDLYRAILSRRPSEEEQTAVTDYLATRSTERETAVSNLIWSLIASNEFCTNH
jgi:uncharacterized protein DUF1549/uncharacterized protein DUF1553